MNRYNEELKLINECTFLEDKLSIFSIYLDIYSIIIKNLGDTLRVQYCHGMMRAYLKVLIESLNSPISESEFAKGLIKGIKKGKLIDNSVVLGILSVYETDIDWLKSRMPYVNEINNLQGDIFFKEKSLIRVRHYLNSVFDNMDIVLKDWILKPFLEDYLTYELTKYVCDFIIKSETSDEFQAYITDKTMIILLNAYKSGRFDYISTRKDMIDFSRTLNEDDLMVLASLFVESFVGLGNASINVTVELCEEFGINKEKVEKTFVKIIEKMREIESQNNKTKQLSLGENNSN